MLYLVEIQGKLCLLETCPSLTRRIKKIIESLYIKCSKIYCI